MKEQITLQIFSITAFTQIVINLRLNTNEIDSQLKMKNLCNYRQFVRSRSLNNLIATQFLLKEFFVRRNWFVRHYSLKESFKRLFFAKTSCQFMTKKDWKVLIIDCIYKINRYAMFLCIIIEVTSLNNSF
jgi:hypothetical protein